MPQAGQSFAGKRLIFAVVSMIGLAASGLAQSASPGALPEKPAEWGDPFAGTGADSHSIHGFVGDYRWLSNFYPCRISFGGLVYGSSEAIYQSCKFPPSEREVYTHLDAAAAKALAHSKNVDAAWWAAREDQVMRDVLWAKFTQNPDLAARLLATGDRYLEETNWWNDTYWGVYQGQGKNVLGRLLMEVRTRLGTEHR
ncbi:MAG: NADAR family protein [Opitutaceae bacterium]|jgi:ribA/ribD-fused uncharacterized protein